MPRGRFKVRYFETSAKMNIGVTEAFEGITRDVVERLSAAPDAQQPGAKSNAKVGQSPADSKGCC